MDNKTSANLTNYDLISQICLKNVSLKQLFKEKKNIPVDQPVELELWLEIISAINLELAEKVGKIEVLLKWYKIITARQGYSQEQIEDTEKQITDILKELINTDLEQIDLEEQIDEEYTITPSLELENEPNLDQKIDLDFHFNFTADNEEEVIEEIETPVNLELEQEETEAFKLDLDFLPIQEEITEEITEEMEEEVTEEMKETEAFKLDLDFLPIQEKITEEMEETPIKIREEMVEYNPETELNLDFISVQEEIEEINQETELNLDFIPLEKIEEEPEIKKEINYETASRADLITQDDQETVNLFDEASPLEAAEENERIFGEDEPITMEELQIVFNRISKLSMRYLGGTLTKSYFYSTQGEDPLSQKFQMNSKGQISILGILSQEVSPQELITFKQWTSKFIKNCSTIISNFPMMVKKQHLFGRLS